MKSFEEIQRAHDILHGLITGETPFVFGEESRPLVHAALDVLCWVLNHDHSNGFRDSLADIEAALAERGYVLQKLPFPMSGPIGGDGTSGEFEQHFME